ncbi:host attachment protein [Roseateles oligotrophus]|uniref:Host attachment protein n=1 Tax=Roseateles oligotrophus TaxID=1769250 RepID=A0ABT2YIN5_9BURK|nr:host attachment protein [Roseateles oligotrophus]MCV2369919.1 host attachment protein [Roseateles oligotrophus]
MTATWIVLCNAARARICERSDRNSELREVADFVHPQSQLKGIDLASDRPGKVMRAIGESSPGGTALDARTDPHRKQHELFARQLASYVDEAVKAKRCGALLLVASNPFLGELKSQLSPACEKVLQGTLPSDLTGLALPELTQRLATL